MLAFTRAQALCFSFFLVHHLFEVPSVHLYLDTNLVSCLFDLVHLREQRDVHPASVQSGRCAELWIRTGLDSGRCGLPTV